MFSLVDPEKINHFQKLAVEESRLGIPILFAYDTIHGYRTIFPVPLGAASSFDPWVASTDATIGARESATVGLKQIYSPMVDVSHEPRWGRIAEGAGEDPYLGSVFAAARVKGAQGGDYSRKDKVVTSVKHYAAYGQPEGGRDYNTTDMSDARLRNLYLPPFKAAIDAGSDTVMCSFNSLNGVPGCANRYIETDILKREWGFDGFIESDYTAVAETRACPPINPDEGPCGHGTAADGPEAAANAINAGTDSEMVSTMIRDNGVELVRSGRVPISRVNDAVRRILRIKFRAGLFEHPYVDVAKAKDEANFVTDADRAAARKAASRSMVLLKNSNGRLPLDPSKKTAVIGPLADSQHDMLGPWWGRGVDGDAVSVLTGIREQSPGATYAQGCSIADEEPPNNSPARECGSDAGFAEAVATAQAADQVVLALGESRGMSGEAASEDRDRPAGAPGGAGQADRRDRQAVRGRAVQRPAADARQRGRGLAGDPRGLVPGRRGRQRRGRRAVRQGQPGRQAAGQLPAAGRPGADLLQPRAHGPAVRRDPEVRLALPRPADLRAAVRVRVRAQLHEVRRHEPAVERARAAAGVTATVNVANTGSREGDEVVQLYIHDPVASLSQPVRRLRGFERVTLKKGANTDVSFTLDGSDFGFYDNRGRFVVEPGKIDVYAGNSSEAALKRSFTVTR